MNAVAFFKLDNSAFFNYNSIFPGKILGLMIKGEMNPRRSLITNEEHVDYLIQHADEIDEILEVKPGINLNDYMRDDGQEVMKLPKIFN